MSSRSKVVLIGASYVGKTSILTRFYKNEFKEGIQPTIEGNFVQIETKTSKFSLWDTAGQEKYQALGSFYYNESCAAIAVFDGSDPDSFDKLGERIEKFKESAKEHSKIFVVKNKIDVEPQLISYEKALEFTNGIENAVLFQTSAKTGEGINELKESICEYIDELEKSLELYNTVELSNDNKNRKNCGC